MNSLLTFELADENATISLGQSLAHLAQKGDVFALYGTLGMGKSVLARAFIQELTGATEVPSPTFTLLQSYDASDFEIYHFDLYRLKTAEEIFEIGVEEALYDGVCLIEWPERMANYLPRDIIKITITPQGQGRCLSIDCDDHAKLSRLSEVQQ